MPKPKTMRILCINEYRDGDTRYEDGPPDTGDPPNGCWYEVDEARAKKLLALRNSQKQPHFTR